MAPGWVPDPNSSGPGDEKISGQIHFHPVRHTFALASRLLSEDAAVLQSAAGPKIIDPDISFFAVVHVEPAAIRRKSKTIGLGKFRSEQGYAAAGVQSVHALIREFLILSGRQIEGWIGKINSAIRAQNDIVGTVEAFTCKLVREDLNLSRAADANDRSKMTCAIEKL